MNKKAVDPYICQNTHVLINYFNVRNQNSLDLLELTFFRKRLAEGIPKGDFDFKHYKSIHKHIFQDLYSWAGVERTIAAGDSERLFVTPERIAQCMDMILNSLKRDNYLKNLEKKEFVKKMAHYFIELSSVHPFRKGNDQTLRLFIDEITYNAGYILIWDKVEKEFYIKASLDGFNGNYDLIVQLFEDIIQLTNKTASEHNDKMKLLDDNNISISDSLYNNILKYIDEVERYEKLLYVVYTKGFEKIDAEITSSLNLQKQSIKGLIHQIRKEKDWDVLNNNKVRFCKEINYSIDFQKVKSDIKNGQLSLDSLNFITNHIKSNALSLGDSKSLKQRQTL